MVDKVEESSYDLALLTRRERDWLLGKVKVSRDYENHMRHRIKRKLEIFSSNEAAATYWTRFDNENK